MPSLKVAIDPPEKLPVTCRANVQIRISWHATAEIRIFGKRPDQSRPNRILEDVLYGVGEGVVIPFLVVDHMIVRLALPACRRQLRAEVVAEKFDGQGLIGVIAKPEPDEVHMVWHQHVGRAGDVETGGSVQQAERPIVMEGIREPAGGAVFDCERPVHKGPAAIEFGRETRQVAFESAWGHSLTLAATGS